MLQENLSFDGWRLPGGCTKCSIWQRMNMRSGAEFSSRAVTKVELTETLTFNTMEEEKDLNTAEDTEATAEDIEETEADAPEVEDEESSDEGEEAAA